MNVPVAPPITPPYRHTPLFPLGPDRMPYRKLTAGGVRFEKTMGHDMLLVEREALRALAKAAFIDINHLVNVNFFWADVSTPFPWASGSWPVSGPTAFTGREPDRLGVTVTVRTP